MICKNSLKKEIGTSRIPPTPHSSLYVSTSAPLSKWSKEEYFVVGTLVRFFLLLCVQQYVQEVLTSHYLIYYHIQNVVFTRKSAYARKSAFARKSASLELAPPFDVKCQMNDSLELGPLFSLQGRSFEKL